jgi:hypothetical protein
VLTVTMASADGACRQPVRACIVQRLYKCSPSIANDNNKASARCAFETGTTARSVSIRLTLKKIQKIVLKFLDHASVNIALRSISIIPCNPILFVIYISTFGNLCKNVYNDLYKRAQ